MLPSRRTFALGLASTFGLGHQPIASAMGKPLEALARLARGGEASDRLLVHTGNDPKETVAFERWLGRSVEGVLVYIGEASWDDFLGSAAWAADRWSSIDRPVTWSVPLLVEGADLIGAALGHYDRYYSEVARILARTRSQDPQIFVRSGWEFNGDWMKWAAKGKEDNFAKAFRRFSKCFKHTSNRFRLEWNVNIGDHGADPVAAYPGDEWVDIIGMDFYWQLRWDPKDPKNAWRYMMERKYGLAWHRDFANTHSKPMAYSEWGVSADDAQLYIQSAAAWFRDNKVLYHGYWDSNFSYAGKLSNGQYPRTGDEFVKQFGLVRERPAR